MGWAWRKTGPVPMAAPGRLRRRSRVVRTSAPSSRAARRAIRWNSAPSLATTPRIRITASSRAAGDLKKSGLSSASSEKLGLALEVLNDCTLPPRAETGTSTNERRGRQRNRHEHPLSLSPRWRLPQQAYYGDSPSRHTPAVTIWFQRHRQPFGFLWAAEFLGICTFTATCRCLPQAPASLRRNG